MSLVPTLLISTNFASSQAAFWSLQAVPVLQLAEISIVVKWWDGQRWSASCWHHPWSLASSMCCANVTCHLSVWTVESSWVESVLLRQVHANQDSGDAVSGIPGDFFRFLRQFRQFVVPSKKQNMYVILYNCMYNLHQIAANECSLRFCPFDLRSKPPQFRSALWMCWHWIVKVWKPSSA